jgi:hypothetical protein
VPLVMFRQPQLVHQLGCHVQNCEVLALGMRQFKFPVLLSSVSVSISLSRAKLTYETYGTSWSILCSSKFQNGLPNGTVVAIHQCTCLKYISQVVIHYFYVKQTPVHVRPVLGIDNIKGPTFWRSGLWSTPCFEVIEKSAFEDFTIIPTTQAF